MLVCLYAWRDGGSISIYTQLASAARMSDFGGAHSSPTFHSHVLAAAAKRLLRVDIYKNLKGACTLVMELSSDLG